MAVMFLLFVSAFLPLTAGAPVEVLSPETAKADVDATGAASKEHLVSQQREQKVLARRGALGESLEFLPFALGEDETEWGEEEDADGLEWAEDVDGWTNHTVPKLNTLQATLEAQVGHTLDCSTVSFGARCAACKPNRQCKGPDDNPGYCVAMHTRKYCRRRFRGRGRKKRKQRNRCIKKRRCTQCWSGSETAVDGSATMTAASCIGGNAKANVQTWNAVCEEGFQEFVPGSDPDEINKCYRTCNVPGQYATAPGYYAHQNSECKDCPTGTYQDEIGQIGCKAFECADGQKLDPDVGLTKPKCEDCAVGRYAATAGGSECLACHAGSSSGAKASECTSCPGGQFAQDPSLGCTACNAGKYSASGAASCIRCPSGTYSEEGSPECNACEEGKFAPEAESGQCTQCDAGSVTNTLGTSCTACNAGQFSKEATYPCEPCDAGSYTDTKTAVGASECTECAAGMFSPVSTDPCQICEGGTYSDQAGSVSCSANPCTAGTFSKHKGDLPDQSPDCDDCEIDTISGPGASSCSPCEGDTSTDGKTGQSACCQGCCPTGAWSKANDQGEKECAFCEAGHYQDQEDSPTECSACPKGKATGVAEGATECKTCEDGKVADDEGKSECESCATGHYPSAGLDECKACAAGQFLSAGSTSCQDCSAGRYTEAEGQASCSAINCNPGSYSNERGLAEASCTPCEAGSYTPVSGATECVPCGPGSYMDEAGSDGCLDCGQGQYQDQHSQEACITFVCDMGKFSDPEVGLSTESCLPCSEGFYASEVGQTQCSQCEGGTYTDQGGEIACQDNTCAVGTFSNEEGLTAKSCSPCGVGHYNAAVGQTACIACSAGSSTEFNEGGKTECMACEVGKYTDQQGQAAASCAGTVDCNIGSFAPACTGIGSADTTCQYGYCRMCTEANANGTNVDINGNIIAEKDCVQHSDSEGKTCGECHFRRLGGGSLGTDTDGDGAATYMVSDNTCQVCSKCTEITDSTCPACMTGICQCETCDWATEYVDDALESIDEEFDAENPEDSESKMKSKSKGKGKVKHTGKAA